MPETEPLRIYVDIDDVLAETVRGMLSIAATRFGRRRRYEEIGEFDLRVSFDFDEPTHRRFMAAVHEPDVLESFDVADGAVEVLEAWRCAGHEICVVTGRPPTSEASTRHWLARHHISHSGLIFVDKYGRYGSPSQGLEALTGIGYAFAVEDSVPMADFLAARGTPVALFSRPWNTDTLLSAGVHRAANWAHVAACFDAQVLSRR